MTHRKGAVWTERLVLALILASLAGTLNLVLAIHRRVHSATLASKAATLPPPGPLADSTVPPMAPPADAPPPVASKPESPPDPPELVEDPTAPILARIDGAIAQETEAAREADRRAAAMEKARQASIAESRRWKRREMLVRQQVATLSRRADQLEQDAVTLDAERDVLARERDALKAALIQDRQRSGYAVLPYKGPNGTWRRPIVLECTANTVKMQPKGPTFSMLELSPLIHPRSSPVILAIAREMLKIQRSETPDGAPAVPYLVFLVRPDGIRAYYQARGRLEPLGIAFGYELIEQDLAVDIPDFDDVRTWDGTIPLDVAAADPNPPGNGPAATDAPRRDDTGEAAVWPGGTRSTTTDASRPGAWPPRGDSPAKPGSDRRWPDLARADGAGAGPRGGAGVSGGGTGSPGVGSGDAPTPEIDLGGTPGQAGGGDGASSGGGGGNSPDDFVWPTTAGGMNPRAAGGTGRPAGRIAPGGAGMGEGFPGTTPGGLAGQGGAGSYGPTSSAGGRPGRTSMGRGPASTDDGPAGGSGDDAGQTPGSPNAGRFIARPADSGRANVSLSGTGGGTGRGGSSSGPADATGAGGGNPDALPELEPVREGSPAYGTPMAGGSPGLGGSGGAGSGGSGRLPSGSMSGSAAGARGESGKPPAGTSGQPGDPASSAGPSGAGAADAGPAPGTAGAGSLGQGGPGSSGPSSGAMANSRGGGSGGSTGPGGDPSDAAAAGGSGPGGGGAGQDGGGAGQDGVAGGAPAGSAGSGGSGDPSGTASGGNAPASASASSAAPASALAASGLGSAAGSNAAAGLGSISGSASTSTSASNASPPSSSLLGAGLGASSASSSSTPDRLLGGSLGSASDLSSSAASGSIGSSFLSSSASSSASSSTSAGGQPGSGTPAGASGMSLPSFNMTPDPNSEPDGLKDLALPPIETHRQPGAIDVPFEIVVVCRRDDLLLHPGGYRITTQSLQAGAGKGDGSDSLLQRELKTLVRRRAQVDPLIRPKPRLKFLVEAGGASTFWKARQQLTFSSLDWPMSVQVAGPQTGYLLDERIRQ